jgi:hypothetical protein
LREFSKLGKDNKFYTETEYPEDAWYEAIVNACVHRSYVLSNKVVFVKIFDDRLVVESPGGFPLRMSFVEVCVGYGADPAVVGLVYIAAHMPDAGENESDSGKRFPSDLSKSNAIGKTADGFTYLDPLQFQEYFAAQRRLSWREQANARFQPSAALPSFRQYPESRKYCQTKPA